MQVPGDEDVLRGKLAMLLLVSPYVDEHGAACLEDSMHLRERLHTQARA